MFFKIIRVYSDFLLILKRSVDLVRDTNEVKKATRYIGYTICTLLGGKSNSVGLGKFQLYMIQGTISTFVLKAASLFLTFSTSFFLARLLGVRDYGIYAYAISWASLLSVPAVAGLDTLLVREVARSRALEDWGSLRGLLRWSDLIVLITSISISVLFAFVWFNWFKKEGSDPEIERSLLLAMVLVPLLSLVLIRQGALLGLGRVIEAQVSQSFVLPGVFLVLVIAFSFISTLNGSSAIMLYISAALIAVGTASYFLKRFLPRVVLDVFPKYCQKKWLKSAIPLFFVGTGMVLNRRISTVMVGGLLGAEAAGIFDVAVQGATLVSFPLMAVNMPLAPAIADLYARAEKEYLQRLITKSARMALLGSLPIALGMILGGRWVLLIFGRGFINGSIALAILSAGQVVNVGMGSVGFMLIMTGHEQEAAIGIVIAALTNVALNMVLVPFWGVTGAATAYTVSLITWNILLAILVHKKLGIYPTALGKLEMRHLL